MYSNVCVFVFCILDELSIIVRGVTTLVSGNLFSWKQMHCRRCLILYSHIYSVPKDIIIDLHHNIDLAERTKKGKLEGLLS